jgi:hypothetical protein
MAVLATLTAIWTSIATARSRPAPRPRIDGEAGGVKARRCAAIAAKRRVRLCRLRLTVSLA